jgi:hypothetical protein
MRCLVRWSATVLTASIVLVWTPTAHAAFEPGTRVLLDAHNCYPYNGRWTDRLDRALSTGTPLAVEQDLVWFRDPATGKGRSLVAHDEPGQPALGLTGHEPTMREYFFERIRPLVEDALRAQRRDTWPIITLNLDLKTEEPEHLAAIWALLNEYKAWLTTAVRSGGIDDVQPLTVGPVLVLTGESDAQRKAFHDALPVGQPLLVFGAARARLRQAGTSAEARVRAGDELPDLAPGARTNYHRWWNNPWSVVERGGQQHAEAWTPDDEARLRRLVEAAHHAGLWIRFYTLNGHDPLDQSGGWSAGYNFGSEEAARQRWRAAIRAGVDFIAVDQYERFNATLREMRPPPSPVVIKGELTHDDDKRLFERSFEVPAGTAGLHLELAYTGGNDNTVIDLGLRGPAGFRGWSGGGPQTIVVGPTRASYGYQPGTIEPGSWAVVLGVPNLRVGRRDSYTITVRFEAVDEMAGPVVRNGPGWFVGDLHAHSGHSDGRTMTARKVSIPVPTHRVFDAARAAGLDFIALTDHNTASHWLDVDRLQPYYDDLLLLHGREITTYRGHANAIGERRFHDFRLGDARISEVLREPASEGAFISINHPTSPDDERCMGCGWNSLDPETLPTVHGVEVVNGDSASGALAGWPFWVDLLNRGLHVTAVGGSDEHTPEETANRRLGRPATVVFATELSEQAIVAGLKAGRVYVRTNGPDGPHLDFSAEGDGQRYEMGQVVQRAGRLTLRATVTKATGQQVVWIKNGKTLSVVSVPVTGELALETATLPGDWFTIVVRAGDVPTAFANAIFIGR